jgi:RecB family endonuclease NucS
MVVMRGSWEQTVIEQEEYLQQYIHANPEALPLDELKDNLRLLVLAREFNTASGPIDALGVDADDEIYVIEAKLDKNADRRRIIAQALDYGAAL